MKLIAVFLGICSLCFSNDIYRAIRQLEFDPTGYFATESSLDKIFNEKPIKTVIEVGSWAGASTRFFGYRVGEEGKVYAIDHWLGTKTHRGEMTDPKLKRIFHLFLSNIRNVGLGDRIVPIRMKSEEAADALEVMADLIYIDAGRDEESVYHDIMRWIPHLKEEGVVCGAEYREPAIRRAVKRAADSLRLNVSSDKRGYFWMLTP